MKQFSIRDLLLAVSIVGLALGWWLDRRPIAARYQGMSSADTPYVVDTATGQVWNNSHPGFYDPKPG